MRITNNLKVRSATDNILRISDQLARVQKQLVTGKKINRPSDDPIGARQIITYQSDSAANKQFIRNAEMSTNFLTRTDSVVDRFRLMAQQAKELAINQSGTLPDSKARLTSSVKIQQWINEGISLANSKFGSNFVFGGKSAHTSPIRQNGSEINYVGDNSEIMVGLYEGGAIPINMLGSDLFASDLNPNIDSNTLISNFHRGSGVPSGQVSITNRLGASSTITISAGATVGQVISQINATGLGVTAAINSAGDGISLTDGNANPTGNLLVQDVGSGTTARKLGIVGNAMRTIEGAKAQPAMTASTSLSLLNGGNGITLSDVSVLNGSASGTVSFGNASTVQDLLNAFNNSGLNVSATINNVGNGLNVASTASGTVAVVLDIGAGTTAAELGVGGGNNFFSALNTFKGALENNDVVAIGAMIETFGVIADNISSARGVIGSRMVSATESSDAHGVSLENSKELIALTENGDFAAAATKLASLETALNASLATTAKVIQPSLIDFLR